ncbi:hypothetical protein [Clostridium baratii]|uniref:Uncharacterized protein n=1 Tax=Clostridium baratii str. Sullivan TaxID=1415775 RepID=A0A0A7FZB6_9CLOT|nr:hypothetical protein [Clostridium baratii]AIY84270.1 hypothetical protein U729_2746 [Clostridium baratii str. Sullivan]MDU1053533.1 hypothetical protein [Clostridium baratii]MDU4910424.1 hypothetical protein [Clostridium baratii]CUP01712.1 Uncharacterised protein [Clostridium baratii]
MDNRVKNLIELILLSINEGNYFDDNKNTNKENHDDINYEFFK